jgi:hypothetical protein
MQSSRTGTPGPGGRREIEYAADVVAVKHNHMAALKEEDEL